MSETVRVAMAGLLANKLRSGLTILGLMIGVGSVIVLIAVGTGSSDAVEKQIDSLGSNVLLITSGARSAASAVRPPAPPRSRSATPRAAKPPPGAGRQVRLAGGQRQCRDADLRHDDVLADRDARHHAGLPTGPELHDGLGSWFTAAQEQAHDRVLVIGPTVAQDLFPGSTRSGHGAGQRHGFRGHRRHRPEGLERDENQDDVAIAPLTAVQDTLTGYG